MVTYNTLILLIAGTVLCIVFFISGYKYRVRYSRDLIHRRDSADKLGKLRIDPAERKSIAKAYSSDIDLDNIVWDAKPMPAPFVGSTDDIYNNDEISMDEHKSSSRNIRKLCEKEDNSLRVFLTGGSTAFGTGSTSDSTRISKLIEDKLSYSYHTY